ncbi:hypothetical protein ASG84_24535 [Rhodococcus sp. Leaf278]|uniref:GGDEF domain-containing protein n=1 Tax=unclassified Rhodococcus (in: high G+C Gram-positive bacteria) TaxID=192944 RepID=UPI00071079B8|nr:MULTISPECIES: GGDEF domain-containing protein [unclassified Rhodococcus (in: high G+C Gram-positive bacteria)]KQU53355.1 hypothetical protein ASG84_24535 [Rhodococcus sp. Leaf278]OZD01145.1 GGDEF domain-containing protein [Rhodococcus sp. 06-235-1A]
MDRFRQWWVSSVDFDWLLGYHRARPFLRYAEALISLYGFLCALLCLGLLVSPDVVVGVTQRGVVCASGVLAVALSVLGVARRIDTRGASLLFTAASDIGIAAVLLSVAPSPIAIVGTTIFTGLGNYVSSFHGPRVFLAHYAFTLLVLCAVAVHVLIEGTWPVATVLTVTGCVFVGLFTSSVIMQALVSHLRHDASGAYFDQLTGLRNRRGLSSAVSELYRTGPAAGSVAWSVVIDLDEFKSINDRFGHGHGDDVLRRTAARIHQACPGSAFAARIGGEEFTVVGRGAEVDARECADRILRSIFRDSDDTPVTASLGVATMAVPRLTEDVASAMTALTGRADAAMYDAKRQGGNRVVQVGHECDDKPEF